MKLTVKILILGLPLLLINACKNNNDSIIQPKVSSIIKILPLGASRVQGAKPEYESYRYELWKELKENDWTFDFIGTQSDNSSYPAFNNENFDINHEGRIGWTSGQILSGLNDWLNKIDSPDIVLFSSPGGNDIFTGLPYEQTVSNINSIIDILQVNNPNVTIIIEQMAPVHSLMLLFAHSFIKQMQQEVLSIVKDKTTSTSQVIAVDMFMGFTDSLLADGLHYNEAGAKFIASRYYNELKNVLE